MKVLIGGSALALSWLVLATPAIAAPRDLYRDKRYAFLELRLHQDTAAATACVLGRIYAGGFQKQSAEVRETAKSGGAQVTMISWGKDRSMSLDVEGGVSGETRIRIHGWQPQFPTLSGTVADYSSCVANSPAAAPGGPYAVDKDRSLVGRIIGDPATAATTIDSAVEAAKIADCVAQYPTKTSYRYNGYYYSPQIVAYPDRTIRIGWYDAGNMVTSPGRIYDWLLLTPSGGGSRISVNLRGGGGPEAAERNWLMRLARGCAASGNSDAVDVWPRS